MVTSLAELNDLVNNVTNYIVEKACRETTDETFSISIDDLDVHDMNCYVSEQDLYEYADFICSELNGRKELKDVDYHDYQFSGTCRREYCSNLEDRRENEPLLPITDTLSMTELSQLGQNAIDDLRDCDLSKLRDSLGMEFSQLYRIGLAKQDHYFSICSADGSYSHWTDNLNIAMIDMKQQCRLGTMPRLDCCFVNRKGEVNHMPIAEACGDKMVSIPAGKVNAQKPQAYWDTMGYLEGDIYKLPTDFKLSYQVSHADSSPAPTAYATLSEAVTAFQDMQKSGAEPILSAQIINHLGKQVETIQLSGENGRAALLSETYPYYTLNLYRERFYPELFRHVFPERELDVNKWSVRVIAPGERYGRNNQLLHDEPTPLVEFRDMTDISPEHPEGILASRLHLDFLIGKDGKGGLYSGQALVLDSANPNWRLSAYEMHPILSWLRLKEAEINKEKTPELANKIRDAEHRCAEQPAGNNSHTQHHIAHQGGVTR